MTVRRKYGTIFIGIYTCQQKNRENTEVYRWNDEFSNYFDDGKDWWGTGLWSAYDKKTGIFIIIGASQTD